MISLYVEESLAGVGDDNPTLEATDNDSFTFLTITPSRMALGMGSVQGSEFQYSVALLPTKRIRY